MGLGYDREAMKKILRDCAIAESGGRDRLSPDISDELAQEVLDSGRHCATQQQIPSVVIYEKLETPIKKTAMIGWKKRLVS